MAVELDRSGKALEQGLGVQGDLSLSKSHQLVEQHLDEVVEAYFGLKRVSDRAADIVEQSLLAKEYPQLLAAKEDIVRGLERAGCSCSVRYFTNKGQDPVVKIVALTSEGEFAIPDYLLLVDAAAPLERGEGKISSKHLMDAPGLEDRDRVEGAFQIERFSTDNPVHLLFTLPSRIDRQCDMLVQYSPGAFAEALEKGAEKASGKSGAYSHLFDEVICSEVRSTLVGLSKGIAGEKEVPELINSSGGFDPENNSFHIGVIVPTAVLDSPRRAELAISVSQREGEISPVAKTVSAKLLTTAVP